MHVSVSLIKLKNLDTTAPLPSKVCFMVLFEIVADLVQIITDVEVIFVFFPIKNEKIKLFSDLTTWKISNLLPETQHLFCLYNK